jgi:biopolymer transport protein ExbD
MPKIHVKKGSVALDMTAMCDVAFLLLTFFILTAKAKPVEPVEVMIPSSIVDIKVPDINVITILVDKAGRAFIGMDNYNNARAEWATQLKSTFNVQLTEEQKVNFVNGGIIAVPAAQLSQYLGADAGLKKDMEAKSLGIPVDTSNSESNELKDWLISARTANQLANTNAGKPKEVASIVIKADSKTPYAAIKKIMKTLQNQKIDRFSLLTSQGSKD